MNHYSSIPDPNLNIEIIYTLQLFQLIHCSRHFLLEILDNVGNIMLFIIHFPNNGIYIIIRQYQTIYQY